MTKVAKTIEKHMGMIFRIRIDHVWLWMRLLWLQPWELLWAHCSPPNLLLCHQLCHQLHKLHKLLSNKPLCWRLLNLLPEALLRLPARLLS